MPARSPLVTGSRRGDTLLLFAFAAIIGGVAPWLPNFQLQFTDGLFTLAGVSIPLWMAASATVAIEYSLAVSFWFPRLRWPTAALGAVFHAGLAWVITIAALDIASLSLYAAFLLPVRSPRED